MNQVSRKIKDFTDLNAWIEGFMILTLADKVDYEDYQKAPDNY